MADDSSFPLQWVVWIVLIVIVLLIMLSIIKGYASDAIAAISK